MNRPSSHRTPSASFSGAAWTMRLVYRPRTLPLAVMPSGGETHRARSLATVSQPRVSGVSSAMPARTMMAARVEGRRAPVDQVGTPPVSDPHPQRLLKAHQWSLTEIAHTADPCGTSLMKVSP